MAVKRVHENLNVSESKKKPRGSFSRPPLMKTEAWMLRFPHLPEQIFQKLDTLSLFKCREVLRSWKTLIDERNYPWLRVVNIPTILKERNHSEWDPNERNRYLHLAAETGQIEAFKIAFNKEKNINIKNDCGETSFHLACKKGHSIIVQFILQKIDVKVKSNSKKNQSIDLNVKTTPMTKEEPGITGLGLACENGHSEVVKILLDNATDLRIDVNQKDDFGRPPLELACMEGHSDVVRNFIEHSMALFIDFKMKDNFFMTFKAACIRGHSDVVQVFFEYSETIGIDIDNLQDINVRKGFNIALREGHSGVQNVFLENTALGARFKNLDRSKICKNLSFNKKNHAFCKNASVNTINKMKKIMESMENCQNLSSTKKRYVLARNASEKLLLEEEERKKENLKQALRDTIKNILKY